jgi:FtsH-binding integral membrane protein
MATFEINRPDSEAMLKVEAADRLGFIRKVYGILSFQLAFTSLVVGTVVCNEDLQISLLNSPWLIAFSIIGVFASMIALMCFPKLSHQVPTNYCLLGLFTACEALFVALVCVKYEPTSVFIAGLMACSATLALTAYACTTKEDFSAAIGFMLVLLVSSIFVLILMPFFISSRPLEILVSALFAVLYGLYIIIDAQLIIGGGRYKISTDDYILGSLYIYVDVIGMFLRILSLIGKAAVH